MSALHPFYPIFDRAEWLIRLLPLGIKLVQLRIKDQPPEVVRAEIRAAKGLCGEHGSTLVVNDHWQIAIAEGCDWVHLGQEDLDTADLDAIKGAGIKLGLSTHDEAELDRALACDPDYVALGPIYPTILKKMTWEQQGLEKLTDWRERVGDLPLIAIGGMTPERGQLALEAGADVVSAVTDITLNEDPEGRVRTWLEQLG
ncbi:MAG: thiamine phosphate synthase [Pseudomonadota bacterium]